MAFIITPTNNYMIHELVKDEYSSFTYNGATALIEYLEPLTEDSVYGDIEFDTVALRCEYSEYAKLDDILSQYDDINTLESLEDNTVVIEFNGGFIIQDF